jgi:maltooligosyltrehalose trehalohydrolase
MSGGPVLGACIADGHVDFRVWAPRAETLDVLLEHENPQLPHRLRMRRDSDGYFSATLPGAADGLLYRYRIDGSSAYPDPASRFQPQGVHGPSQVVNLRRFAWSDENWRGITADNLVIYELHVGTFSPEGTFEGVRRRLGRLRELGVSAIELMPVGDFPGSRNWGYDGVALFAPARCYGKPEDLQRLVDSAHELGLAVILDVVYNHFGPDGNYTGLYSSSYMVKSRWNEWGDCVNLDGPGSGPVREFFIQNALHWLREFHVDGLRLDATHALVDESQRHFLAELTERVRQCIRDREIVLIAEDERNLARLAQRAEQGGFGLDAIWADDFHHEIRRLLAGDDEGYFRDYDGSVAQLAEILNRGWLYCGEHSVHQGGPRGSKPEGLAPEQFIFCLQNHDQVGNRALGERLHHQIDPAAYRAASAVLLLAPEAPLLFMGQEWAASTPFRYFTDHHAELGRNIAEGRRNEFRHFKAFVEPAMRERIPDPQADETFRSSRLDWGECERQPHRGTWELYRSLLHLRHAEPALGKSTRRKFSAIAWDDETLVLSFAAQDGSALLLVARLRGAGVFRLAKRAGAGVPRGARWQTVLHTEEPRFVAQPQALEISTADAELVVRFPRPGAIVLRTVME